MAAKPDLLWTKEKVALGNSYDNHESEGYKELDILQTLRETLHKLPII